MKKLKVLIIICIAIVLTLIGILLINKAKEKKINDDLISDEQKMGIGEFSNNIIEEVSYSELLQVKQSINQYLSTINKNSSAYYGRDENNNFVKVVQETEIKKNIYCLLSKNYIEEHAINIENVYNYVDDVTNNQTYTILKLNKVVTSNCSQYIVQGFIEEKNEFKGAKNFIVNFNLQESIFSIEPIGENIDITNINIKTVEIEKNDYNSIPKALATTDNVVKEYFNTTKKLLLLYPEKAYEYLDEEYKNAKFQSYEDFKEYINNNLDRFSTMYISEYTKTVTDNYTQYVCIDQNDNYYIIKENAIMDFDIILDTYTIELPEFIEKYQVATDQQKVALNIDRFIQAINDKSYYYAYNCLADSYKNNYFKTLEEFENYAKQNFYEKSTVEYKQFNLEGELYTYLVLLTNEESGDEMNKTFICSLGEGTEFVLSFNK